MTDRETMQQALEALESAKMNHGKMLLSDPPQEAWRFHRVDETLSDAITALRAALAEPEQEPVVLNGGRLTQYPDGSIGVGTPAKPDQWQGLTEDEKNAMVEWAHPDIIEAIELKLRERNP